MAVGEFYYRLRFERRASATDEYGNVETVFTAQFTRSASITPLRGGETVMASRLAGVQPVLIRVYLDSETENITPGWQAVDTRSGQIYALRSVADMEQKRQFLTITAEAGVAS